MNTFQLYKPDQNPSTKLTYLKRNIDLEQFKQSSQLICNKIKEMEHADKENMQTALNTYLDDTLKLAKKELVIEQENYDRFLSLISGEQQHIPDGSLFDFFKLSNLFKISKLSDFIKTRCSKARDILNIITIIKKGDKIYKISKNEEIFYNKFIELGDMDKILSQNIQKLFESIDSKDNFPLSTLFILLQKCKSNEGIPSDKLYEMISKSFEEQLHFIPYIDIYRLNETNKKNLFARLKEIEDKLNQSKVESFGRIEDILLYADSNAPHVDAGLGEATSTMSSFYQTQTYKPKVQDTAANPTSSIQNSNKSQSKSPNVNDDLPKNPYVNYPTLSTVADDDLIDFSQNSDQCQENDFVTSGLSVSSKSQQDNSTKADNITNPDSISRTRSNDPSLHNNSDFTTSKGGIKRTESDNNKYHPPTSYVNKQRIDIFNENKKIVQAGFYSTPLFKYDIRKDYDYSLKNTFVISDHYQFKLDQNILMKAKHLTANDKCQICKKVEVTKESTFAAAIQGKGISKKICALNFASATQPGGGVLNGRNAQEEVLSRQSTLYFSISQMKDFYEHNKRKNDPVGTDYMIYSPNVIIIRDDNDKLIPPVKVSVISSVAFNYGEYLKKNKSIDNSYVSKVMLNRCRRILELCIDRGNDVIVLGAFGCGVFQNPPEIISKVFRDLIVEEGYGLFFKKIVFAIKIKPDQTTELIDTFKNAFLTKPQSTHHKK